MVAVGSSHGDREKKAQKSDAAHDALAAESNQQIIALPVPGDLDSIATHPPGGTPLTEDAARILTDAIKRDAQSLWMMLLRAYEGGAHVALGYANWSAYCAAELQIGRTRSYQLLDAARVAEHIQSTMVDSLTKAPNERIARALAPLLDDPDELRETYTEAVQTAPRDVTGSSKVTAPHVAATVERRRELRPRENSEPITAKPKTAIGLNDAVAALRRAVERDRDSAPAALATLQDIAARGLYGPQTSDPVAAFRELTEIVALLLGRRP